MPAATTFIALAALGGGTYFGKENLDAANDQRRKQSDLEKQRTKQLSDEAAARDAAKARAATSGQRVGTRTTMMQNLGFGSGNTNQGLGSGSLFGN